MHGQTEQLKPLGQLCHESLCLILVLETRHNIIGISDHGRLAAKHFPVPFLHPQVKYIVQVDIG